MGRVDECALRRKTVGRILSFPLVERNRVAVGELRDLTLANAATEKLRAEDAAVATMSMMLGRRESFIISQKREREEHRQRELDRCMDICMDRWIDGWADSN